MSEQVEVLSLIGDVALKDGEPKVHAHVVVGRSDGSTRGGHLMDGPCQADAGGHPDRVARAFAETSRRRERAGADPDLTGARMNAKKSVRSTGNGRSAIIATGEAANFDVAAV